MTQEVLKLALDKKADNARELGLDYEPENTLHWHALNYRTAPTQNAQAMFEALEKFVEAAIKEALREHAMREVQRLGQEIEQPKVRTGDCLLVGVCASEGHKIAPQRTWVGLTDDEIKKIAKKHKWHEGNVEPHLMPVFRSLEAKLKELNT